MYKLQMTGLSNCRTTYASALASKLTDTDKKHSFVFEYVSDTFLLDMDLESILLTYRCKGELASKLLISSTFSLISQQNIVIRSIF